MLVALEYQENRKQKTENIVSAVAGRGDGDRLLAYRPPRASVLGSGRWSPGLLIGPSSCAPSMRATQSSSSALELVQRNSRRSIVPQLSPSSMPLHLVRSEASALQPIHGACQQLPGCRQLTLVLSPRMMRSRHLADCSWNLANGCPQARPPTAWGADPLMPAAELLMLVICCCMNRPMPPVVRLFPATR